MNELQVTEEYGASIAAKMNVIRMEDFFQKTRHNYSVVDCKIGNVDCQDKFKVIGTLNGNCLAYNPCSQQFSRDSEFRITLSENKKGNRKHCK